MASPKKIFFSYSSENEDLALYEKIHKHFAAYSKVGLLSIIDRNELFRISGDNSKVSELQKDTDITVPLLSVDFVNDEECLQQLKNAASNEKIIVPILLRDFDWEAFQNLQQYKKQMLPDSLTSVEERITADKNDDTVFKEIALPEIREISFQHSSGTFYYVIAAMVLLIGILGAWFIYDQYNDYRISIAAFLMSAVIAMIALKNVLFPDKLKIKK